ncbi:hypothetical protein FQN60_005723 [Etheostoma spectabile]|uniref:CHCH domain-containing protein n=1 Tax=Etheostoma spectabile TaxID=54343 RepID=A0A5J5CF27_9PERO|nr:hypothetical protein FQN60_005723 [Etheostoma spectabile]
MEEGIDSGPKGVDSQQPRSGLMHWWADEITLWKTESLTTCGLIMGASNSTRRVSFESDENENITVVKGIRLSENVINRMREPEAPHKHQHAPSPPPSMAPTLTPSLLRPVPPLFDPITSLPSPPPLVEPVAPPAAPSATETVAAPLPPPPQPPTEQVAAPTIIDMVLPSSSPPAAANAVTAPAYEEVPPPPAPAAVEPVILPPSLPPAAPVAPLILAPCPAPAVVEAITPLAPPPLAIETSPPPINQSIAFTPPVIEPVAPPHVIEPIAPSPVVEPIPPPLSVKMEPTIAPPITESKPLSAPPVFEPVAMLPPPLHPSGDTLSTQSAEPFAAPYAAPSLPEYTAPCEPVAPPSQPPVTPESLAPIPEPVIVPESVLVPPPPPAAPVGEVCSGVAAEKARAEAQAQDDAQSKVQDEVSRILSVERAMAQESIQQAVIRERITTEDERLRAQLYTSAFPSVDFSNSAACGAKLAQWPINHWPQRFTETQALTPRQTFQSNLESSIFPSSKLWPRYYVLVISKRHAQNKKESPPLLTQALRSPPPLYKTAVSGKCPAHFFGMLLPSLSKGAGNGAMEVVSPTKAVGLEVSAYPGSPPPPVTASSLGEQKEIGRKAKQLGAREADLNKQDAFYREQVARLEERSAQFYKVTSENYHKAADQGAIRLHSNVGKVDEEPAGVVISESGQTEQRFDPSVRRYEAYPVCADLQGQILACYRENTGKTLQCSNIAALYLQCVNNAKQTDPSISHFLSKGRARSLFAVSVMFARIKMKEKKELAQQVENRGLRKREKEREQ